MKDSIQHMNNYYYYYRGRNIKMTNVVFRITINFSTVFNLNEFNFNFGFNCTRVHDVPISHQLTEINRQFSIL